METVVAFVVDQVRVEDPPDEITVGFAAKLSITGAAAFTMTVTVEVALPPGPVAVSV